MIFPANLGEAEINRLRKLYSYKILDTANEKQYDDLAALAAKVAGCPVALISLVDQHRQWFKAHYGTSLTTTPRQSSFCGEAIKDLKPLIISDTLRHPLFKDNPMVTKDPFVRFYAGFPLVTSENIVLGTLCLIDFSPKNLTVSQIEDLTILASQVMTLMDNHRLNRELKASQEELVRTARSALITEMTKSVSHEINNPLTTLLNAYSVIEEFTKEQKACTVREEKACAKVLSSIERIRKVVRALSELNHSEMGQIKTKTYSEVFEQAINVLSQNHRSDGVDLTLPDLKNLDLKIPQITEEVLFHLLSNACFAAKNNQDRKPQVVIESYVELDKLIIKFIDSGKGVPDHVQHSLFAPFFHSGYEGKPVGLGLSVCKSIMDSIQGSVRFVSNSPTTFEIVIPLLR